MSNQSLDRETKNSTEHAESEGTSPFVHSVSLACGVAGGLSSAMVVSDLAGPIAAVVAGTICGSVCGVLGAIGAGFLKRR